MHRTSGTNAAGRYEYVFGPWRVAATPMGLALLLTRLAARIVVWPMLATTALVVAVAALT